MATANVKVAITAEDKASSVVQGFGGSITKMAGAVALGQLAVQGLNAVMSKFADAGRFAIDSASDFQQSRIAFETMLGSADKARKMLKDVSDFAMKTPFELPEVVTGAKQLLAYGIEAEKIIPTFKNLGNIAAGVGKDKLPQLILAYGQVRAATKLTGAELRQFTEAGVPLLEELAKQSGKSTAQVKEDMERGLAPSFSDVEKALAGMSGEGGKFFDLLDKQSKTFGGTLSNIRDNFVRVSLEILGMSEQGDIKEGSIFYYLQKGAEGFLKWLNENKTTIVAVFDSMFQGLKWIGENVVKPVFEYLRNNGPAILDGLRQAWEALKPGLAGVWFIIKTQLWPALQDLWNTIQTQLLPVLQEFWDKNQNWIIPALQALAVVVGVVLLGAILGFIALLKVTVVAISWLGTGFNWVVEQIKAGIGWVVERVTYMKDHFWESIGFIIGFFATLPLKILFYVGLAITGAVNYIQKIDWWGVLSGIWNAWTRLGGFVNNAVADMINRAIHADWGAIGRSVGNAIVGALEGAINGAISGIPGAPHIKIPRFATGVQNFTGGLAVVGERGPELVNLPRGSDVIPNNKLAGGGGSTNQTTININVGLMTGSAIERREAAAKMFEDLKDIAGMQGQTVAQMIGI